VSEPVESAYKPRPGAEKVIVAGVRRDHALGFDESMDELRRLAESAGLNVVGRMTQTMRSPSPSTYVGKGKVIEIADAAKENGAQAVLFNNELKPGQQRALEEGTLIKIVDRTQLILDIFAQRARTSEGKLQVELAQLEYMLPRLTGKGSAMTKLGGGVGTRGPGEQELEVDRRRIRRRIQTLKTAINEVSRTRTLQRSARQSVPVPIVSLVGYTNAGKSTLMNTLSKSKIRTEDRLFSTLDPTTRRMRLTRAGGQEILLTDTVGFIRDLPHGLVASFRATLEEVTEADLLLHVVDASSESHDAQMQTVRDVLEELKSADKPTLLVFNKADRLDPEALAHVTHEARERDGVVVSAVRGTGLNALQDAIARHLRRVWREVSLFLPFKRGDLHRLVKAQGQVVKEEFREDGIAVTAFVADALLGRLKEYVVPEKTS